MPQHHASSRNHRGGTSAHQTVYPWRTITTSCSAQERKVNHDTTFSTASPSLTSPLKSTDIKPLPRQAAKLSLPRSPHPNADLSRQGRRIRSLRVPQRRHASNTGALGFCQRKVPASEAIGVGLWLALCLGWGICLGELGTCGLSIACESTAWDRGEQQELASITSAENGNDNKFDHARKDVLIVV
jgi:hypothetical protein